MPMTHGRRRYGSRHNYTSENNPNPLAFAEKPSGLFSRLISAITAFPLTALSVLSPKPVEEVHYYRIPKTGSSALLTRIKETSRPVPCNFGVTCAPEADTRIFERDCGTSRLRVLVHDHVGGCKGSACNGSMTAHSFAVLREPCDRFVSVLDQISLLPLAPHELGQSFAGRWHNETAAFAAFVTRLLDGCAGDDVERAVRTLRKRVNGDTRVFLYPQAYFVATSRPHDAIVCYDAAQLGKRVDDYLARRTRCRPSTVAPATNTSKATDSSNVTAAHMPGRAVFGSSLQKRNVHRHVEPGSGSSVSVRSHFAGTAWCRQVRTRLYVRDAQLWDEHCAAAHGK